MTEPTSVQAAGNCSSPLVDQYLLQTRPWVRLLSVLTFIGAGLMVLVALGVLIAGFAAGAAADRSGGGAFAMLGWVGVAVLCLAGAILYVIPGLYLSRYATAITRFNREQANRLPLLEDALKHQKSFWRFVGILTLVMMAFYAVALVLGVLAGVGGALLSAPR